MNYDILIIGGGINGAGIARDAAGRGASVALLEQGDLATAQFSGVIEEQHFQPTRIVAFFVHGWFISTPSPSTVVPSRPSTCL